jgi:hypothetical protein
MSTFTRYLIAPERRRAHGGEGGFCDNIGSMMAGMIPVVGLMRITAFINPAYPVSGEAEIYRSIYGSSELNLFNMFLPLPVDDLPSLGP